jgi:adenylate cyclase
LSEQVFVARERELSEMHAFLDRALAGQGRVCFVIGEAGSGKTALVTEFARRAQELHSDLLVAIGNCNAQTGLGDPYLPFREVLGLLIGDVEAKLAREAITDENASRLRGFLVRSGQILIEVGPDLVGALVPGSKLIALVGKAVAEKVGWTDKLEQLVRRKQEKPGAAQPSIEQSHIFEQYTAVLAALAAQQPLMLVVDDLQWIDAASVSLLFHLGRRIERSHILIVGGYRPADVALGRGGERHPLESVVNEFSRYYGDIWVDLGQTAEPEGRQFVDAFLDTEPNRLGEAFRQALFGHTAGHPLFTIELLQDMQERGDLTLDEEGRWVEGPALDWSALPLRVESVIEERIGRLDAELRETLTVASVEGANFTAEVVARVQGLDERGLVRRLSGELEKKHRLVQAQGTRRLGPQRLSLYRFWHSLFQTYLYNGLDEAERAYLHEDVGNALEALHGDQTEQIAVQLAWHFEAAGMAQKAIDYLRQAGERAQALYAPREAVEHFTRALEAMERASMSPPAELYRARGQAYQTLGEFERAHTDYAAALDVAQTADDPHEAWQTLVDLGQLWASRDYARAGEYYQQALQRARALGDSATIAHSLNHMGNWHLNIEQPLEALRFHEEALAIFQRLDDRPGVAETLDLLAMASALGGDLVQSMAYYEQAVALFRELGDRHGLASSMASVLGGWDYLSETMVSASASGAQCVRGGEEALRIARETSWRSGEAYTLLALGFCLGPQGDYARALSHAQAGLDIAKEIEHQQWICAANCGLGALHLDLLALPAARQHLEQALALAKEIGSLFWTRATTGFLASTYVLQNELGLAETALSAALEPDTPLQTMAQRRAWYARGELALAAGDPALALQIADQLIASAANLSPGHAIPPLSKLRGEALAALGQTEEAEAELQAALETARAQGTRPILWRIHTVLGNLHRAAGQPEEAEREFAAARTIVAELATNIPDKALRDNFLQRTTALWRR